MITSSKNRWLKDMRRLRTSKGRREAERLLLEGPHLIGEAIDAALELDVVLATPEFLGGPAAGSLSSRLERPPLQVEADLLAQSGDADSPRGIAAIGRLQWASLDQVAMGLRDSGDSARPRLFVFADGLQDPGNLGALARVAEAAGVEALLLSPGSVAPNHPRALRASAGSLLRLPTVPSTEAVEVDRALKAEWCALQTRGGQTLYGLDNEDQSAPGARGQARILAVGAEGAGLSAQVEQLSSLGLTIPLAGEVESLNATVAAAIVLFEWRRQALRSD